MSKRSGRGGQSLAVISEQKSNAASGCPCKKRQASGNRLAETITVQSPTQ